MFEWNSPIPWVFMIPVIAIVGGITVAIVSTIAKARVRELEIKERIAMIERGLVPPPEVDPQRFDRVMDRIERVRAADHRGVYGNASSGRHRRAGVTLMGVGFGLMVLIGFAGDAPESAVGVGGFLVVMGLAFFINSLFEARQPMPSSRDAAGPTTTPPPPSTPN
jgi:hypothetical protein